MSTATQTQQTTALARDEQSEKNSVVQYIPFGASDAIKLSIRIVREMIARPTKAGRIIDDWQALRFITLCKSRGLNPFEGDAFVVGYDGEDGPEFSLITAHQAFLKRAEVNPEYDGMESGVVGRGADGKIFERETDLLFDDEVLLGGWAKVYVKNRSRPTYRRLGFSVFSTGRSRWKKDPAGMIVKCAEADALRSTFPTKLGGLYTEGELQEPVEIKALPSTEKKSATDNLAAKLGANGPPQENADIRHLGDEDKPKPERPSSSADAASAPEQDATAPGTESSEVEQSVRNETITDIRERTAAITTELEAAAISERIRSCAWLGAEWVGALSDELHAKNAAVFGTVKAAKMRKTGAPTK